MIRDFACKAWLNRDYRPRRWHVIVGFAVFILALGIGN